MPVASCTTCKYFAPGGYCGLGLNPKDYYQELCSKQVIGDTAKQGITGPPWVIEPYTKPKPIGGSIIPVTRKIPSARGTSCYELILDNDYSYPSYNLIGYMIGVMYGWDILTQALGKCYFNSATKWPKHLRCSGGLVELTRYIRPYNTLPNPFFDSTNYIPSRLCVWLAADVSMQRQRLTFSVAQLPVPQRSPGIKDAEVSTKIQLPEHYWWLNIDLPLETLLPMHALLLTILNIVDSKTLRRGVAVEVPFREALDVGLTCKGKPLRMWESMIYSFLQKYVMPGSEWVIRDYREEVVSLRERSTPHT